MRPVISVESLEAADKSNILPPVELTSVICFPGENRTFEFNLHHSGRRGPANACMYKLEENNMLLSAWRNDRSMVCPEVMKYVCFPEMYNFIDPLY